MTNKDKEALLLAAGEARRAAYAPYSGFLVGAALLAEDGRIFSGCNVECGSYTPTVCAERVALGTAVAAGARRFVAIAVVGGHGEVEEPCPPCGVCRQALSEFSDGSLSVVFRDGDGFRTVALSDLFPYGFKL